MPSTLHNAELTLPDNSVVTDGKKKMARATLPDNRTQERLSAVVSEAARQTYGKQEAAALELKKDPGNFSRDIKAGRVTLADLADLGPMFLARLGAELTHEFGQSLKSRKDAARERLPELIRELLEATA